MTGNLLVLLGAALASAVETVEALTIVLALGVTRGWRGRCRASSPRWSSSSVLVAALGPALEWCRSTCSGSIVGSLLLVFGLQWLRKAILRASGLKALHDEDAIFAAEVAVAEALAVALPARSVQPLIVFKSCSSRGSRWRSS